jgi:Rad3-related DNA helicase
MWIGCANVITGASPGTQSIARWLFPSQLSSGAARSGRRRLSGAGQWRRLFLAAPTGIGKTISVLFPAVKALGEGKLERIFYLTARTVGRAIAEKALADLRRAD